jgi:hypothetical protein
MDHGLNLPRASHSHELTLQFVRPDVFCSICQAAAIAGVTISDEYVYRGGALTPLLGQLLKAGGSWRPLAGPIEWIAEIVALPPDEDAVVLSAHPDVDLGTAELPVRAYHAHGALLLTLGDVQIVAVGGDVKDGRLRRQAGAAFFGPSREVVGWFLRELARSLPLPRLHIWGGTLKDATPGTVPEDQVVLPGDAKVDLLAWLDRFWRLRAMALDHRLPLRRGLLLAGPPGTGKTHLIRHVLTRYPDAPAHLFIAARRGSNDDPFGELLRALRREERGAIVILEDIDRLTDSGAVTKEYLLNALDGFVEIPVPLLWIATTNDPTMLEKNLLQRPGRFDRVIVFDLPGREERRALVQQHSGQPLDLCTLDRLAASAEGLTGAHIREACAAATLAWLDKASEYVQALEAEIASLRQQHAAAERMHRGLAAGVGFH